MQRLFCLTLPAALLLSSSVAYARPSILQTGATKALASEIASVTVVSVGDGDTLRVKDRQGKISTVRLGCVDASELKQHLYGKNARDRLQQLVPTDTIVTMRTIDRDRYGRTVAELYKDDLSINLELVLEGQAVVYPQYIDGCNATKDRYNQAQAQAKKKRLGIWQQSFPVMPWDFRRGKSTTRANPIVPAAFTRSNNFPACIQSDGNCSDFNTQADAQRIFDAFPGDPFSLDRDADSIPCESLP